jgi:hypothetical protein
MLDQLARGSTQEKERFRGDPNAYMDSHGLTDAQRAAVLSGLLGDSRPLDSQIREFAGTGAVPAPIIWSPLLIFW